MMTSYSSLGWLSGHCSVQFLLPETAFFRSDRAENRVMGGASQNGDVLSL